MPPEPSPDYPRRVLIAGSGGRENALGNALLKSPRLERLFISPANYGLFDPLALGGAPHRAQCLPRPALDISGITDACREQQVDLAVVGPEDPLVAGLADSLRAAGIPCVGPGKAAAQLEGSKAFAKAFMLKQGIPTAAFREFGAVYADPLPLRQYLEAQAQGCVLKCDGLAAGKGVMVCATREAALAAFERIAVRQEFGPAGDRVVVEELLSGPEISFTCLLAGGRAEVLPPSSDYKRLQDGDAGPNTGGMGNICPSPWATDAVVAEFAQRILAPTLRGLAAEGLDYRGFLFVGAMLTAQGLRVIEYNVRFGDPEAAVVLPLCEADWPALLFAIAQGELPAGGHIGSAIRIREGACVAVVLASADYPYSRSPPVPIEGLGRLGARDSALGGALLSGPAAPLALYFAGVGAEAPPEPYQNYFTAAQAGQGYLASGGRVLTISARGRDLSEARRLAYEALGNLRFAGMQYRSDIGRLPA